MKITEVLQAEHTVFHNLFDHMEHVLPALKTLAEVKGMARTLEFMLLSHARVEDELVINPLEHCLEQMGQRENFHHEHEEIDGNLRRIQAVRSVAEARRLLQATVHYSRRHFVNEERIVFPLAEKVLKKKTLEDLGRACLERRKDILAH